MGKAGAILALAVTALAGSAATADAPPPLTPLEQAAIARAEARGQTIYAYDQAAWYATDEMVRLTPQDQILKGGGWLVEPKGDLLRVVFYGQVADAPPEAFFWADMRGSKVVASHRIGSDDAKALNPEEARMAAARRAAIADAISRKLEFCTTGRPNTVVLPATSADAPSPVYMLTAQVTTGEFPFGGHYELDVGADGRVVGERPFTKACLNMSPPPQAKGQPVAAAGVSHSLDPVPTEIHVWLSLWTGHPIFVITGPDRMWPVIGGHVGAPQVFGAKR
jgi:hypothetical protein